MPQKDIKKKNCKTRNFKGGCNMKPEYVDRIKSFFEYTDKNNSERITKKKYLSFQKIKPNLYEKGTALGALHPKPCF